MFSLPSSRRSKISPSETRRPILEFLEERAAPGDLLGLGLTAGLLIGPGNRSLFGLAKAAQSPGTNKNKVPSPSTPARQANPESSQPARPTTGAQADNGQGLSRDSLFAFPANPIQGGSNSRSSSFSLTAPGSDYSALGGIPPHGGLPNFGTPGLIPPPNDGPSNGNPAKRPPVYTPPQGGTTSVSFIRISPDTGSSSTDAITMDQKPSILGKASPGALVTISEGGATVGTGIANMAGYYTVPVFQALADGVHSLAITAQKDGQSAGQAIAQVTVDTTPPQLAITAPPSVTNGSAPVITAVSSQGGMVSIDVDLNMDGHFTGSEMAFARAASGRPLALNSLKQQQGIFNIRARQSDIAGNVGLAETSTTIDPNAGFVGDSRLRAMVQPVLRELGISGKWDGKAVSVPANYTPADSSLTDRITVSLRCVSPRQFEAFKDGVRALGMDMVATNDRDMLVDGNLPLYRVLSLPGVEGFSAATFVPKALTRAGSVQNQGVPVMGIPQFIQQTGVNGAGITIGVISDSANAVAPRVAGSISTGDLPTNTTILADDPTGSDEGRAMMEVAYDAAPGVELAFSTGGISPQTFANAIVNLANFGCEVITDDLVFLTQPIFNDGRVSQAAQTVSNNGVVYTSAFGNQADWGWQANWSATTGTIGSGASAITGTFMNLGGGDYLQNLTLPVGDSFTLAFQWNAAFLEGGSSQANYQVPNNLDAHLINLTTGQVVASGSDINQNTDQGSEIFSYQNTTTGTSFALAFQLVSGPAPTRLAWINYGRVDIQAQGQGATTSQGTATAPGVIAVAAASAQTPATPETFTSLGGALPFYYDTFTGARLSTPQIRQKPDITAPDGISTTLSPTSGLNPFFGTSCSAPQVAAAAALLLSSNPSATGDDVFFHLVTTASKIYAPGLEDYVGAGMTTVVPFPIIQPPDPSGDPLFPTMAGTVGSASVVLKNHSIANNAGKPDTDWFALRPASNGTLNVSMFNGPGGSLEMRLYTLGARVNMVERARSVKQGLTNRNLAITVTANQFVYIKVNGRTSSPGVIDQAMYQLTLNMS